MTDPILDELHAIRRQMLEECGGDVDKLVAGIRERQDRSGRIVSPTPVRPSVGNDGQKATCATDRTG